MKIDYDAPQTAREARQRVNQYVSEIQSIEAQMADRNKGNAAGKRFNAKQYAAWRKNALNALAAKQKQLRLTKAWLREHVNEILMSALDIDGSDPEQLLRACYQAHEKIKRDIGVRKLGADVLAVMDLVRNYALGLD